MAKVSAKAPKKKIRRSVAHGFVYVNASVNNTIITLADDKGAVLGWASSGVSGFKGPRKSTPFAAQMSAEKIVQTARLYNMVKADVRIKGIGAGREQAVRALQANGLEIVSITDVTPVPHNGCRRKKPRRV